MTSRSWRASASVGLVALGCGSHLDLPRPPHDREAQAVRAEYDEPTGHLEPAEVGEVARDVRARLDELDIDWFPVLVAELLVALRDRFEESSLPTDPEEEPDPDRASIDAVVDLRRLCTGWSGDDSVGAETLGAAGADDTAGDEGLVHLTAIVENTRLSPELWASLRTCRTQLRVLGRPLELLLDGTLLLYLYDALPAVESDADYWVAYVGQVGSPDREPRTLVVEFRVRAGGLELLHPVKDGNIVVRLDADVGFGLRGRDTSVTCGFDLACR